MSGPLLAGIADQSCSLEGLREQLAFTRGLATAEQVHGASLADVGHVSTAPVAGCDGLTTRVPRLALVIRSADCLPLFVWDPIRRAIGLIHAGWRGLAKALPLRLIGFMHQQYHSRPSDLWVAIGPAIRACCYEVGAEFQASFGPYLRTIDSRRMCDLVACATDQLAVAGVRSSQVVDCGECTACHPARWHSFRRDGERGERLFSFIVLNDR